MYDQGVADMTDFSKKTKLSKNLQVFQDNIEINDELGNIEHAVIVLHSMFSEMLMTSTVHQIFNIPRKHLFIPA